MVKWMCNIRTDGRMSTVESRNRLHSNTMMKCLVILKEWKSFWTRKRQISLDNNLREHEVQQQEEIWKNEKKLAKERNASKLFIKACLTLESLEKTLNHT